MEKTVAKQEFAPIKGESSTLFVLRDKANYFKSMRVIEESRFLRSLRYQIVGLLMRDATLLAPLKGQSIWLGDEVGIRGMKPDSLYTMDENGQLAEGTGGLSPENALSLWNGKNPLRLWIHSDEETAANGKRFHLNATTDPFSEASIVVGKIVEPIPADLLRQGREELESLLRTWTSGRYTALRKILGMQ